MEQELSSVERRVEIRWSDLDSSRHVNNAVYLSYLEEVRTAWLEQALGSRHPPVGGRRVAVDRTVQERGPARQLGETSGLTVPKRIHCPDLTKMSQWNGLGAP